MPGPVPGIYDLLRERKQNVDGTESWACLTFC